MVLDYTRLERKMVVSDQWQWETCCAALPANALPQQWQTKLPLSLHHINLALASLAEQRL